MMHANNTGRETCCICLQYDMSKCSLKLFVNGISPSIETFLGLLRTCREKRDLSLSLHIHLCMCSYGLEAQKVLGDYLVSLLVDIGSVQYAQQVFGKLLHHDEVSLDPLITFYADHEDFSKAILLYTKTRDNISFRPYVFFALLRSCTMLKDLERGHQIHSDIARRGLLEENRLMAFATMNMYAKCGSVDKAQEVFDSVHVKDIVLWKTLILAYINCGQEQEALLCFARMQKNDMILDAAIVVFVLKSCGLVGDICQGHKMHNEVVKRGWLEENVFISSALVGMYGRCGFLDDAQEVFDNLPISNEVSWITMMAALVEHGCFEEALFHHKKMHHKGIPPHPGTLVCSLKACGSVGAMVDGQELHSEIVKTGLDSDGMIGNTLIDMYSKCHLLQEAQNVFDKLVNRNIVSWTALAGGFVECGYDEIAVQLLGKMESSQLIPDATTSICSLKACCSSQELIDGYKIHSNVIKFGHNERNNFVGAALVNMYAKCGALEESQKVLIDLCKTLIAAWNALLAGYADCGCYEAVLNCFDQMVCEGLLADHTTFGYCIGVCGSIQSFTKGHEFHDLVVKRGMEGDELVGSSLVDMYARCSLLGEAHEVQTGLSDSVNSWASIIAGYADHGQGEEALKCYIQATSAGIWCNCHMLVSILKACILTAALRRGREIHALIVKQGMLEADIAMANVLVLLYAKHGLIEEAHNALKGFSVRGLVAWTALISGCVDHRRHDDALHCFEQMRQEGIFPDSIAFACSLSACGTTGSAIVGLTMHTDINSAGLETEPTVGNAVVDMYTKCGSICAAQCVFDKLPIREVVSWNALITGYAQVGESETVFQTVDNMIADGIQPDKYTFFSILNVCSHAGLVETGQTKYKDLVEVFDIVPTYEHLTCMVDLFARAACVESAVELVKEMPFHPDIVVWRAVLGACRMHGYLELGRHTFQQSMQLNERDATTYVNLSNLFVVDAGMFTQH